MEPLPGEFFTASNDNSVDPTTYVAKLRSTMQTIRATPTRHSPRNHVYVSDALTSASHVFIRHDAVRKPLQPPYDGPYKVLNRADKYYTVDINGRHDTVSVDRLKPAYLDDVPPNTPVTPAPSSSALTPPPHPPGQSANPVPGAPSTPTVPPTRTTRSGRRVHWPSHLADFVHLP